MSDQSIVEVTQADRQRIPGSIPSAVDVWRDAYVAVYGCEPTHPGAAYQGAYDVIERAMRAIDAASMDARIAEREACAAMLERAIGEGYPTPVNKVDACAHDKFGWEDCIACYDERLMEVAAAIRARS